jgi:hypothetical protein
LATLPLQRAHKVAQSLIPTGQNLAHWAELSVPGAVSSSGRLTRTGPVIEKKREKRKVEAVFALDGRFFALQSRHHISHPWHRVKGKTLESGATGASP